MDDEKANMGGNIELTGFRDIDSSSMTVLKKIINNHAKRISHIAKKLEVLHITLKAVHEREKSEKYEVHAKIIDDGKVYASEITERNLFIAVDSALNKIIHEMN